MSFPDRVYPQPSGYVCAYRDEIARAWQTLDVGAFDRAASLLDAAIRDRRTIYADGNGGSTATANHLLCDVVKGVQTDTELQPKVVRLAANLELITAIANDTAYDEVSAYQLRTAAEPGDVLLTISASGNSENIVRAADWARNHGVASIAMTGFNGGRSVPLADINLHIKAENYGIIEDVQQSPTHSFVQYLRQWAIAPDLVIQRCF